MAWSLIGVFVILHALCLVHSVRTGRARTWLYVYMLIFLPVAGMIAYVVAEIVPDLLRSARLSEARQALSRRLDPERDYRYASAEAQANPSNRNLLALAGVALQVGRPTEAAGLYRRCLVGHDSNDPALLIGLARAELQAGRPLETKSALDRLRLTHPEYQSSEGHLLYARALETLGAVEQALREYAALVEYYPGPEAAVREAELLDHQGRKAQADLAWQVLRERYERAPRHLRQRYKSWWDRVLAKS